MIAGACGAERKVAKRKWKGGYCFEHCLGVIFVVAVAAFVVLVVAVVVVAAAAEPCSPSLRGYSHSLELQDLS